MNFTNILCNLKSYVYWVFKNKQKKLVNYLIITNKRAKLVVESKR